MSFKEVFRRARDYTEGGRTLLWKALGISEDRSKEIWKMTGKIYKETRKFGDSLVKIAEFCKNDEEILLAFGMLNFYRGWDEGYSRCMMEAISNAIQAIQEVMGDDSENVIGG